MVTNFIDEKSPSKERKKIFPLPPLARGNDFPKSIAIHKKGAKTQNLFPQLLTTLFVTPSLLSRFLALGLSLSRFLGLFFVLSPFFRASKKTLFSQSGFDITGMVKGVRAARAGV